MSNYKTTLQTNNESLSSNNTDLQSLIDQANALPDVGSAEPEMATVTINYTSNKPSVYVYYPNTSSSNGYSSLYVTSTLKTKTFKVPVGTGVYVTRSGNPSYTTPSVTYSGEYKVARTSSAYNSTSATYRSYIAFVIVRGDCAMS